jgi:aminomuconate-semialdehyde/2-hydroxymuconate-6-semialdehyde dehydrogenase
LVERSVYDEFLSRFVPVAAGMVSGDPRDAATQVGPLASRTHFQKVVEYFERIPADGGHVLCGGPAGDGSWIVRPTVVVDAPLTSALYREEVFGPIVTVSPFDTSDEAVSLANDTPYGLNAMLFTENVRRAHRVAAALRAGTVWVNCFFVRDLRAPFGGIGDSGIGREGGDFSREFCTEAKAIVMEL